MSAAIPQVMAIGDAAKDFIGKRVKRNEATVVLRRGAGAIVTQHLNPDHLIHPPIMGNADDDFTIEATRGPRTAAKCQLELCQRRLQPPPTKCGKESVKGQQGPADTQYRVVLVLLIKPSFTIPFLRQTFQCQGHSSYVGLRRTRWGEMRPKLPQPSLIDPTGTPSSTQLTAVETNADWRNASIFVSMEPRHMLIML